MTKYTRGQMYRQGGSKLQANDIVAVKYVTVIGHVGDFAVYMGESSQSDQDIAQRGDKVDEATARAVAPYCAHLTYRP